MIWVIGHHGMLGTQLCEDLKKNNIDFAGSGSETDICNLELLEKFAEEKSKSGSEINLIVNCSAYTKVDLAEDEKDEAYKINVLGVKNICLVAKKIGAALIHISTDYVFDGEGSSPYRESDEVCPIGVYGQTKLDGEKQVCEILSNDKYYILRTAWLYGKYGKNFAATMISLMNARDNLKVVSDQRGTPTNCCTLSDVILRIIKGNCSIQAGIYHVTDEGETTWFDFAKEIFECGKKSSVIKNTACVINPCTTEEYPAKAKRPHYSVLSKEKIQRELNFKLPDWKDSLKNYFSQI